MQTWEIEARLGIEDTIGRYVRFADSGRSEHLAQLFTEDGVLRSGADELRGRDAIVAYLDEAKASLAAGSGGGRIRHHVSSLRIELAGPDRAAATSYFLAVTALGPDHWGLYRDVLVPTREGWRFQRREAVVEGTAPASWAATRQGR